MQGNICRCACYGRIRDAIQMAAKEGGAVNA
jgi:aerobic-type carbon monoxide dehydrogenase small subunit (CoxS/CutS family)